MSKDSEESDSWIDIHDWLGTEDPNWSPRKVKELLRSLIDSKLIYTFSEAGLYSFLLRKGVLNLANRHGDFLNNLAKASKTKAGLEAIKDYATSDSQVPPDISHYAADEIQTDTEAEIKTATSEELAGLIQDGETLDSDQIIPVEHILSTAEVIDSISVDEEAIQFYLNYCINQLWKDAFLDEKETINRLEKAGKSGNKYRDLVSGTFLKDYYASKNLKIPKNYIFQNLGGTPRPQPLALGCTGSHFYGSHFGNLGSHLPGSQLPTGTSLSSGNHLSGHSFPPLSHNSSDR